MNIELQEIDMLQADSGPYGIAVSREGNVWFTQHKANKISCLHQDGTIKEYIVPTPDARVLCLTISSIGDIWFTENGKDKIGRLSATGVFTEYPLPHAHSAPYGITEGLHGDIWFT
ncbi:Virginiamycin B lyase, partial [Bacillus mojavensis]|nr:Virginiamycin B lyase [Bacillus mojavensis]